MDPIRAPMGCTGAPVDHIETLMDSRGAPTRNSYGTHGRSHKGSYVFHRSFYGVHGNSYGVDKLTFPGLCVLDTRIQPATQAGKKGSLRKRRYVFCAIPTR